MGSGLWIVADFEHWFDATQFVEESHNTLVISGGVGFQDEWAVEKREAVLASVDRNRRGHRGLGGRLGSLLPIDGRVSVDLEETTDDQ